MPNNRYGSRLGALAARRRISDTPWPFQAPTKSPPQQIVVTKQPSLEENLERQLCLKFGAKQPPPAAKKMTKQQSPPEKAAKVQSIPVKQLVASYHPSPIFQGPEDPEQERLTRLAKAIRKLRDDCVGSDEDLQLRMGSKYGILSLLQGESTEIEERCNSEASTWEAVPKCGRNFNEGKVCKSDLRFSQANSYSTLDRKQMEDVEAKRRHKAKIVQLKEWEDRSYKMTGEELIERDRRYGHRQPGATFTVKVPGNWLKNR
ncbi:unnamed protein product, partial [Mesorhabditis belari]|uniref:Uncharacterized protein n=1 Tax=Mesorhabditis belari TaxID=2138241 RepID=A0AAF3EEA6_9BILA